MKSWQPIQVGIVTPGADESMGEAPNVLLRALAGASTGDPVAIPFDRGSSRRHAALDACVAVHAAVTRALVAGQQPLVLGGECTLIAGTLSAAADELADLRLLYLDAHGDFNTAATSPSGYLGGRCLAHVCGDFAAELPWLRAAPFPGERVFLLGGRSLDPGEGANLARRGVRIIDQNTTIPCAARTPAWIHLDLDVVTPSEMFAVGFPAEGGIAFDALTAWLARAMSAFDVRGVAVCGYQPAKDAGRVLPGRIAAALRPIFRADHH